MVRLDPEESRAAARIIAAYGERAMAIKALFIAGDSIDDLPPVLRSQIDRAVADPDYIPAPEETDW